MSFIFNYVVKIVHFVLDLAKSKQEVEEKMQRLVGRVVDDLHFDNAKRIKLECNDQHGYFFRVTLAEEQALRQNKQYRIIDAVKGGVRFTHDKLEKLNETYTNIKQSYELQQKSLVEEIINVAGKCILITK